MRKHHYLSCIFISFFLSLSSCYNKKEKNDDKEIKDDDFPTYYSLKITTNNRNSLNYSVNVDNLDKIKEGTKVTISNTPGYYKIVQFEDDKNNVLSRGNSYTFKIESNVEIKIIFIYSLSYYTSTQIINNQSMPVNVVLMAGQSNMEGWDGYYSSLNTSVVEDYENGHENVKINYNCCEGKNYTFGIESCGAFTSVKFGQGKTNKELGPEIGLSKFLGNNSKDEEYYLIKVAHGGTTLNEEWNPENIDLTYQTVEGKRYMFKRFIASVDSCIDSFLRNKVNFSIKGMCWFQGEYDAKVKSYADNYDKNFKYLQSSIKNKYGKYYSDDFKWISAGISTTSPSWIYNSIINEALRNNSDKYISETETLERVNNAHYTAQSYLTVGECFGRELLS